MNNGSSGNRFFDGFLWGAIIGGGLVFFLGTKKGKKLLKTITEEGVEGLTELLEQQDLGEYEEENVSVSPDTNGISKKKTEEAIEQRPVSNRRFFKKSPKANAY